MIHLISRPSHIIGKLHRWRTVCGLPAADQSTTGWRSAATCHDCLKR